MPEKVCECWHRKSEHDDGLRACRGVAAIAGDRENDRFGGIEIVAREIPCDCAAFVFSHWNEVKVADA